MNSIRKRLLLWQSAAILLAALLVSLVTYHLAWDGFNRIRDQTLEDIARSIIRHGKDESRPHVSNTTGQFVSQIWDEKGEPKFSSLPELDLPRQEPGLHSIEWQQEEWHIFTLRQDGVTVQVANTSANRARMFAKISPWLLLPLVILVIALGGLLSVAVRKALAPLDTIRREISDRDGRHLEALSAETYPDEIAPLVAALNNLLSRLNRAMNMQRDFVANAAHELRTPLTAIKLQTQIILSDPGPDERTAALKILRDSVDRATRMIEQLLQLARFDPESTGKRVMAPVELDTLARQAVGDFSPWAEEKHIDLGVGHCDAVTIGADGESLRVLLDNLIDNSLQYCPRDSRIDVEVRREGAGANLWVIDNGPGIPDAEKSRVFDRFHRLAGAHMRGSGLGLAIVEEIVTQHGGQVRLLDTPGGGLSVCACFPA